MSPLSMEACSRFGASRCRTRGCAMSGRKSPAKKRDKPRHADRECDERTGGGVAGERLRQARFSLLRAPTHLASGPAPRMVWKPPAGQESRGRPRWRSGSLLGSFWVRSGFVLGSFWVRSGFVLGSFWVRSGFVLGSFWVRSGFVPVWKTATNTGILRCFKREKKYLRRKRRDMHRSKLFTSFTVDPKPPFT